MKYGNRDYRAVVAQVRAKLPVGWPPAPLPEKFLDQKLRYGARSSKSAPMKSTGKTGIGTKSVKIYFGRQTLRLLAHGKSIWTNSEKWFLRRCEDRNSGPRGAWLDWGPHYMTSWTPDIASGLMSINAVKGVEIGDGMATAAYTGQDNADEMRIIDGQPAFTSNHAGGILGGISSGQDMLRDLP